ncbi:MAG TPA: anthranilate synthase component I family protein [Segetibacter sp.]
MTRVYHTFEVEDISLLKQQMLNWGNRFNICCFLDNQQYSSSYHSYESLLAVGSVGAFEPGADFLSSLSDFLQTNRDWIFGHFNYEIAQKFEKVYADEIHPASFPHCFLFVPQVVLLLKQNRLTIGAINESPISIFSDLLQDKAPVKTSHVISFSQKISREEYLNVVLNLKKHIHHGDCYEINFCQEFFANANIDPASVFLQLTKISPNPFSAFYRVNDNYLLSASPERYLKKTGDKMISQPIKGTAARSADSFEDEVNKKVLRDSAKDKSENVMIVDLVRNDLSKICREGSVVVEELFAVYSFPHVHQMISTIGGILRKDADFADIMKATFPMGSMTGAPKKKVMELIEKYEKGKRGIYSGTVGYFTPDKDFDFNVVIRSIVYNDKTKYLSFHTGGAITASSEPEKEYEECLLKGKAILKVFSGEAEQPFVS